MFKKSLFVLTLMVVASVSVAATGYTWNVASGEWSVAANWTPVGTPLSTSDQATIANGGTITISAGNMITSDFAIGVGGNGIVDQTAGIVSTNMLHVGYHYGAGILGTYNLSGGTLQGASGGYLSTMYVGEYATGIFNHTGGSAAVSQLYVGTTSNGPGTYNMNAGATGTLTINSFLKVGAGGTGLFQQDSGTVTMNAGSTLTVNKTYNLDGGTLDLFTLGTNSLVIGASGTSGVFNLDGGALTATSSTYIRIGNASGATSTFNFDSGTIEAFASRFYVGDATGSTGHLNFNGGSFVGVANRRINLYVGEYGTGYVNQSAGVATGDRFSVLRVGSQSGSVGTYTMGVNTSLTVYDSSFSVGYGGQGTFNQGSGTVSARGALYIGYQSTGQGTYNIGSGGDLDAGSDLYVGYDTDNIDNAVFNQTGGSVDVVGKVYIGYSNSGFSGSQMGRGIYNMSGGTLDVGASMYVGNYNTDEDETSSPTDIRDGRLFFSGGDITVQDNIWVSGPDSYIDDAGNVNGAITLGGDFMSFSEDEVNFDMTHTTLNMTDGDTGWDPVGEEWNANKLRMGDVVDMGNDFAGLEDNFALGTLSFEGTGTGSVWYMLESDVYCYDIEIASGASVFLNGYTIYYTTGDNLFDGHWEGGGMVELGGCVIPEPNTIILIGTGVLGLAAVLRKKIC